MDAILFFELALNYWQLYLNSTEELVNRGNKSSIQWQGWDGVDSEVMDEAFKWSDSRIAEPLLFLFYHGVELSLKSLVILNSGELAKGTHSLSGLLSDVGDKISSCDFMIFYEKYICLKNCPEIFREFCCSSGCNVDDYYQSLKYPVHSKGFKFNHALLRCNESDGLDFFKQSIDDLMAARIAIKRFIAESCGSDR
ncbi:HEPN domain-containing protein [Chitinibacter sp. ZOR0017]|uniref:HEPN domain-containing protein n=1 Tax=Chitinibacter sp. ZOR0017 TaxID=1339254 RepID=UPI000647AAFD|nr:HEPN domain-containing protein [Chitinibacter sp. ZOR0017]